VLFYLRQKSNLPFMRRLSSALLILLVLASCQTVSTEKEPAATETTEVAEETALGTLLNGKKQLFLAKGDSAKIADYDNGLRAVEETGISESALNVGDEAAAFTLKNQVGEEVSLVELLEDGPVILTWYRGGWCPYCNITLAFLQEKLPEFELAGAQLVVLTPELPDSSMSTSEKHELGFDILSDVGNKVAHEYGLVYKLTDVVAARYQKGFNLHAYNGDETDELPLAATYVIDMDSKIRYAFLDVDYRNRAEPSKVLDVLNNMN
jgi:peroxiredoxin